MAILDPILYANGELRLTDHGPRGGGVVLVWDRNGKTMQVDIGDIAKTDAAIRYLLDLGRAPDVIFGYCEQWYAKARSTDHGLEVA